MIRRFLGLAVATLLVTAGAARAQSQLDFSLQNNTGNTVLQLFVSPASQSSWGPDILGAGTIANGAAAAISFTPAATGCSWDMRVVFAGGPASIYSGLNLCTISKLTLVDAATAAAE